MEPIRVASLKPGYKWVMVDSGSGEHCCWAEEEFPDHAVERSPGQQSGQTMETACKGMLQNEGQILVDFETQEGIQSNVTFQNVRVSTPILSVRKLVRKGHQVSFRRGGGTITAAETGDKMEFEERGGVYYIQLKILPPKKKKISSDFVRRG